MCTADGRVFGSVAEALRMANATMDYLNSPEAADLDPAACGTVLRSLAEVQAKFTAAHAAVLARFDAADAHDADGYGNSVAWLMAMTDMTRPDAKTKVWRMRLLRDHPEMADALASADISKSQALAIAKWTKKLPAELRAETIKILVEAAAAGASLDDLRIIAGVALQKWRASRPDADDDGFDDRYVQAGTTFGGAGVIRGNLTPECAAAVQAVLEALGKKAGVRGFPHRGAAVPRRAAAGLRAADPREDGAGPGGRGHPCGGAHPVPGAAAAPRRAGGRGGVAARHGRRAGLPDRQGRRGGRLRRGRRTGGHRARRHAGGRQDHRPRAGRGRHHPGRRRTRDPADDGDDDDAPAGQRGRRRRPRGSWGIAGRRSAGAASRARSRARERFTPDAMQALRYAIARLAIELRLRPGRPRRLAAHHPPRTPVQHPVAAAGHRLLRLHPGQHPPRRPAPRPRLRLAPLRQDPPPGATCTTCSTRKTAAKPPSATACCCASSTTTSASTAAAGGSSCTPTAPPPPTDPTGRCCTATHHPPSAPGKPVCRCPSLGWAHGYATGSPAVGRRVGTRLARA